MSFEEDLTLLGFRLVQDRGTGRLQYAKKMTPFLTYWVHWDTAEDSVLFTWEHAVGEYVDSLGMQIGANEPLNSFLYPKFDARGPADITFVVRESDRADAILRAVNLAHGET